MQCHEVVPLLSAYDDDELPPDRAAIVTSHVESSPRCTAELEWFRKMSDLTSQLYRPSPPSHVWQRIATQLDADALLAKATVKPSNRIRHLTLLAVVVLVAAAIGRRRQGIDCRHGGRWQDLLTFKSDERSTLTSLPRTPRSP